VINNLEIIKPILSFLSEDDFYHLQIIKRKKEHPDLGSNSYIVKTYYIRSLDYLDKKMPEIIALCNFHNARVYINPNVRSFEKLAFQMLKKVTDQIMNKDFKSVRKAYESVTGEFSTGRDKKWILDFDMKYSEMLMQQLKSEIYNTQPYTTFIHAVVPTKNGFHVICSPFNIQEFRQNYTETWKLFELHKNNPTILYIP